MTRVAEAFARTPLAAAVDLEVFRRHCPSAHVLRRLGGETVFDDGADGRAFHFVVDGRVKLVKRSRGPRDAILDLVCEGECVCQSIPMRSGGYCCTAIADAPITRVLVVARAEVLGLMTSEPPVAGAMIDMLVRRTRAMCGRVVELSSGTSVQRVASELLRLAERYGEPRGDAVWVPVGLSRRDLAELTGMAVETAIRAARRLERAGLVRNAPGGFEIPDLAALRARQV